MRKFSLLLLAVATLTALATPSFAQEPAFDLDPLGIFPQAPVARPAPSVADYTNPGYVYAQPNGAGQYDCQLGERRTRLQRRACGPLMNQYGD